MTTYSEQIAIEKQKIEMFQSKIEQCKKRISSLEFLMEDSGDELDALASNMITATTSEQAVHTPSHFVVRTPKKRLGPKAIKLLKYIGSEGKELKELVVFAKENNMNLNDGNLRNFAMIYRKNYGYLESPHSGFYRLTKVGKNAIAAL